MKPYMIKGFNIAHYLDNKLKYVPLKGDEDQLWDYICNKLYLSKSCWTYTEWQKAVKEIMESELTVGEYLNEFS